MPALNRRRFMAITAAAALAGRASHAAPLHQWKGIALGASATIVLSHPDAPRIVERAVAEIGRLEDVFSLYRPQSAISRLNRDCALSAPPFELLECLGLCGHVHRATGGFFDPTIQPLWEAYAKAFTAGHPPGPADIAGSLDRIGWEAVEIDAAEIRFSRPGMALSLNGIAQGYIADRVARLLSDEGLSDILIDTGEIRALGGHPGGGGWPVTIDPGTGGTASMGGQPLSLRDTAIATSRPLGTTFDPAGRVGHILDPHTGLPATQLRAVVSVTADSAATADALSTAFCLMADDEVERAIAQFATARIVMLG